MALHLQLAWLTCLPHCYPLFQLSSFTFIVLSTPEPNILECGAIKEKDT